MATKIDILLRHPHIADVALFLENFYTVGRKSLKDAPCLTEFFDKKNWPRTLILHQENTPNWVRAEIDLSNLYEFDEVLRRFTDVFQTLAILGYKQTTSGDARFAVFEKGKMIRSVVQQIDQQSARITDNFGRKFHFETAQYPKPVYFDVSSRDIFNYYDDMQIWYEELGYEWGRNKEVNIEYLHLEIIDFKT